MVRMFVKWHGLRHPRDMGPLEIEGFSLPRFDRGVVVVRQAKGDNDRDRECGVTPQKP